MVQTANTIWRDYVADGVPSSGKSKPKKSEIRTWGTWIEGIITAFTSNGGLIYSSKAAMDADLAHAANSMAWVVGDATVANNGVYRKIGASGTGSWTRVADLPYPFIPASDVGAGTPNAIQATTPIPVSESSLIWVDLFEPNDDSPVTISFNGGSALTIRTNTNNDPVMGGLSGVLLGRIRGTAFRLISDQASAAIIAQAESWANIAQAAANGNLVFVTRAAAAAATIDASINSVMLKGDASEGDGLGGLFVDTDNGSSDTFMSSGGTARTWYRAADVGTGRLRDEAVSFSKVGTDIKASATVLLTVGTGGQFATIGAALAEASKLKLRTYVFGGFTVEVRLLSGFQMAEQVYVNNLDLSYVTITSVDAEVTIVRSALTVQVGGGSDPDYPAFSAKQNAGMPRIEVLFNMDTSGSADGRTAFYFEDRSFGIIGAGKGCKNAGARGIEARHNCNVLANSTVFTNAGDRALYALHGSNIYAELANVSGCKGQIAVYALMGAFIMFVDGNAQNKQNAGPALWANRGGWIVATGVNASGALNQSSTEGVIYATDGGRITADASFCNNSSGNAFAAGYGGHISCRQAEAKDAAVSGVWAFDGGTISANNVVATGCTQHGIFAQDGSMIDAKSATASGCGTGVRSNHGSRVNFNGGVATGYVTRGAHAERGGYINVNLANCRKAGSDTATDIVSLSNGKIDALGATGGLSITANSIVSAGLINQ